MLSLTTNLVSFRTIKLFLVPIFCASELNASRQLLLRTLALSIVASVLASFENNIHIFVAHMLQRMLIKPYLSVLVLCLVERDFDLFFIKLMLGIRYPTSWLSSSCVLMLKKWVLIYYHFFNEKKISLMILDENTCSMKMKLIFR